MKVVNRFITTDQRKLAKGDLVCTVVDELLNRLPGAAVIEISLWEPNEAPQL